ncbi:MAG: acyl-CoA dehydrogenase family protein [Candidatus Schekmanbacteria bacterium]|nr:acyl-CoA dehydrogenase family protein [Candidatus Schekmanbacteria bacterium]
MLNLEIPKQLKAVADAAHEIGAGMFRPISRKYDTAEHEYPRELEMLHAMLSGIDDGGAAVGARELRKQAAPEAAPGGRPKVRNGRNMAAVLNIEALSWGDVGLLLTIPGHGLGNAAIAAVATPEQKQRFGGKWAAMAITEPEAGSDSANIRATAVLDGDCWVLNGEKIFVTCGERAALIVVWATLDKALGRAAIKSFVVERGTPGMELVGLEKKLGIRASDTATLLFRDCRIPRSNILGSEEVKVAQGFAGVMETFDNTRPLVAAMAVGIAGAALETTQRLLAKEGIATGYVANLAHTNALAAELHRMEAELEAARLLTLKAAWMADNGRPNSMEASMAKAKAGRVGSQITLRCVALCGSVGYSEEELLEKWARDAKILDIFEGTQQIQQLIIARRLLGKTSRDLR